MGLEWGAKPGLGCLWDGIGNDRMLTGVMTTERGCVARLGDPKSSPSNVLCRVANV